MNFVYFVSFGGKIIAHTKTHRPITVGTLFSYTFPKQTEERYVSSFQKKPELEDTPFERLYLEGEVAYGYNLNSMNKLFMALTPPSKIRRKLQKEEETLLQSVFINIIKGHNEAFDKSNLRQR